MKVKCYVYSVGESYNVEFAYFNDNDDFVRKLNGRELKDYLRSLGAEVLL